LLFRVADPFGFKRVGVLTANKLVRVHGRGHLPFITCNCYRRLPLLGSVRARNTFVEILNGVLNLGFVA
jgi:hypothetical protein